MPVLPNAPLVEAMFEIKWGEIKYTSPNEHQYEEKLKDSQLLPGQLSAVTKNHGYPFTETLSNNPPLPFLPRFRYRKSIANWPCFQLGTGIFTINQVKEGYGGGAAFKQIIIQGLHFLEEVLPNGLASLPLMSVELKYQDGLTSETETVSEIAQSNLNIQITPPPKLLDHPDCNEHSFACNHFELENKITAPIGTLKISMAKAKISNNDGLLLTSSVKTGKEDLDKEISIDQLSSWLDDAHKILKHTFEHIFTDEAHERFSHV